MRKCLMPTLILVAMASVGCQHAELRGYAAFGAQFEPNDAMPLSAAVAHVDEQAGKPVCVKAKIGEVCRKMGCWMLLTDGERDVRVRFTASEKCTDGFLLPRNAAGHEAYAVGMLKQETISEDDARHYASDDDKPAEEIEQIKGPQQVVTMLATGVMISDGDTLEPPVR
ncbi:MAG: DUF4920 domain-containing protein [Phycisphaerae bacterium]